MNEFNVAKIESLNVGDIFYECELGMNIEARVTSAPIETDFDGKRQFSWSAENTQTGAPISYRWTEGLSYYGPRLYPSPQYAKIKDGGAVFSLVGEEA